MVKLFFATLLSAGALVCLVAVVSGAGTASVGVSATVTAGCAFGATSSLDFGVIQHGGAAPISTANPVAATVTCTSGTNYSISDNGGLRGSYLLNSAEGNTLPYSVSYTGNGIATDSLINLTISATVQPADYNEVPPGQYSDTLLLTVNY